MATGPKFREEMPKQSAGGGDPKLNKAAEDRDKRWGKIIS